MHGISVTCRDSGSSGASALKPTCMSGLSRYLANRNKCNLVVARSNKTKLTRAADPIAHEGAQIHRTHRLLQLARQIEDLVRQRHKHGHQADGLGVVPWSAVRLWNKVRLSGVGLLQDARWEIVKHCCLPSLNHICRLAADLRAETIQAHEDDRENRMTTWKNWLRTDYEAACSWCERVDNGKSSWCSVRMALTHQDALAGREQFEASFGEHIPAACERIVSKLNGEILKTCV